MSKTVSCSILGLVFGVVLSVTGTGLAEAYETAPVTNGGTLQGKVMFKGTPPPPKVFELWRFPDKIFCGGISEKGRRLLREVIAGPDGGLKDVVVVIEGIQKGKPFTFTSAQMDANVCQFIPFVSVVS